MKLMAKFLGMAGGVAGIIGGVIILSGHAGTETVMGVREGLVYGIGAIAFAGMACCFSAGKEAAARPGWAAKVVILAAAGGLVTGRWYFLPAAILLAASGFSFLFAARQNRS